MTRTAAWLLGAAILAGPASAAEPQPGTVVGWVEDTHGAPISGALISLFGKGVRGSGLVTFTDSAGRFSTETSTKGV